MTSPTEKHISAAIEILDERFIALLGVDRLGACVQIVARALDNAEREGMETERTRCADIVERFAPGGDLYSEVFIDNDVAIRVAIRGEILSEAGEE